MYVIFSRHRINCSLRKWVENDSLKKLRDLERSELYVGNRDFIDSLRYFYADLFIQSAVEQMVFRPAAALEPGSDALCSAAGSIEKGKLVSATNFYADSGNDFDRLWRDGDLFDILTFWETIMRKTGLRVGILLLILGFIIGGICFLLPSLTANRISLSQSAFGLIPAGVFFLLGLVFTILSIIFTFRAKRVAAIYKSRLEPEGIIFFEEDVKGSMTFRNFKSPARYSSWRKVLITSLLILTKKNIIALKGSSPIIDVPVTDPRLKQMKFSLEGENTLLVAFAANLFQPDWSGEIEYRFQTGQAPEFLKKLNEITSDVIN
jgi:hypothetical protein